MDNRNSTSLWLPLVTAFLFSGSFLSGKIATASLGPLSMSFGRYIIALCFLTSLLFFTQQKVAKISMRDLWLFILLGLFGVVGYHFFFFLSLHYTNITHTAIINALNPTVTAILACILTKEKLSFSGWLGILLALVGVLLLITQGHLLSLLTLPLNRGDLLMMIAVVCWAIYALFVKQAAKRYDGLTITYMTTLFGVVILLPLAGWEWHISVQQQLNKSALLSLLYMGIMGSGISYFLYNKSVLRLGVTQTATVVYGTVPIFVAMWGILFFADRLSGYLIGSLLMIFAGIILLFNLHKKLLLIKR